LSQEGVVGARWSELARSDFAADQEIKSRLIAG